MVSPGPISACAVSKTKSKRGHKHGVCHVPGHVQVCNPSERASEGAGDRERERELSDQSATHTACLILSWWPSTTRLIEQRWETPFGDVLQSHAISGTAQQEQRRHRCVTTRPAARWKSGYPSGPADTHAVWAALRKVPVFLCACVRACKKYSRRCGSARIYVSEVSLAAAEDAARKPLLTDWGKQR